MEGRITRRESDALSWAGFSQAMHERGITPLMAMNAVDAHVGSIKRQIAQSPVYAERISLTPRQKLAARFVERLGPRWLDPVTGLHDSPIDPVVKMELRRISEVALLLADAILADGKEEE